MIRLLSVFLGFITTAITFLNKYFKIILQMTKEYHAKYQSTPNFDTLEQIVKSEISQELVAITINIEIRYKIMNTIETTIPNS